jgi:biopolymer transport protein ExbD
MVLGMVSEARGSLLRSNVTPLIDVLLVLLIIFMVIVPVLPRGLGAELPSASTGSQPKEDPDRLVLVRMESKGTRPNTLSTSGL